MRALLFFHLGSPCPYHEGRWHREKSSSFPPRVRTALGGKEGNANANPSNQLNWFWYETEVCSQVTKGFRQGKKRLRGLESQRQKSVHISFPAMTTERIGFQFSLHSAERRYSQNWEKAKLNRKMILDILNKGTTEHLRGKAATPHLSFPLASSSRQVLGFRFPFVLSSFLQVPARRTLVTGMKKKSSWKISCLPRLLSVVDCCATVQNGNLKPGHYVSVYKALFIKKRKISHPILFGQDQRPSSDDLFLLSVQANHY